MVAEPFSQWVIEDRFPPGARLVARGRANWSPMSRRTRTMKLRLLNGSHSTLAYLGYLAGYKTIADDHGRPNFVAPSRAALMDDDMAPTLMMPPGADLAEYKRCAARAVRQPGAASIAPGRSPWTARRNCRSACSAPIRERLQAGARSRARARGRGLDALCHRHATRTARTIDVRDPLAVRLRQIADDAGLNAERLAPALLAVEEIFGRDLASDPRFMMPVTAALERLYAVGTRRAIAELVGGGLRAFSTSFGINKPLLQAFQTFYYTRAVELVPSLAGFADARGKEPGTLRGSQWSPSIFLGDRERGFFGGASFFFDYQARPGKGNSSLISSTITTGYSWDCCAVTMQYNTYNVGVRQEKGMLFSFRLNGIGTFGTEQIGQRFR